MISKDIKVLIVEDSSDDMVLITAYLKKIGFQNIDSAGDGEEALEKLNGNTFGLIIADLNMPRMDGMELFRELNKREDMKKIPFLLITAEERIERLEELLKVGISDYLLKPFTASDLETRIQNLFNPA